MGPRISNNTQSNARETGQVPWRGLFWFAPMTFAITWGIAGFYIFMPELAVGLFGEMEGIHPLYFLATWGPAIAGILTVMIFTGRSGLRVFMSRMLAWRAEPVWWAIVLIGFPIIFMAGSLVKGGPLLAPMENGAGEVVLIAIIMLFLGPVEELGWRGVAQPLLQRHMAPVWAGAVIGAVWGIWHLPAFYLSGTVYTEWNFPLFLVGTITMGVLVTPMFNAGRGGLFLPMMFHWQLILPIWPDAQPWDTWMLVALTLVVLWWKRDSMFSRQGAVTDVIPALR